MKEELFQQIDRSADQLIAMANTIFDHPELGNQEILASTLLCDMLQQNGFTVEKGVGGLPTAFRAVYQNKENGPSIGLLCEYDALEGLGHACGHHLQGPAILGCAAAIKEKLTEMPYKLVVYGTPAEETTSGKVTMLANGCFTDIDVALMLHANPGTTVDIRSMALTTFTVTFHGVTAHAAVKPEAGRSALDALLLAFQGIEFMREHVADDVRMHYTVVDAGGAANSVPAKAVGHFYLRSYHRSQLDDVIRRFENVMKGAALMTDTTVEIQAEKAIDSKIPVYALNDLIMANARLLQAPDLCPPREKTGSTDFGNVMYRVPGSCLRMGFVKQGTASHSQAYLDAGKGEAAVTAVLTGAKILAATAYDLICDEELISRVKTEFSANQRAEGGL